jgi:LysM repeat protein
MKKPKKTCSRRTRRLPDEEPEEDIFNPFAPIWRQMRRVVGGAVARQRHPFRDTFITVVLLHLLGVLIFMTYGAVKGSERSQTSAKYPERNKNSHIAKVLDSAPEPAINHQDNRPAQASEMSGPAAPAVAERFATRNSPPAFAQPGINEDAPRPAVTMPQPAPMRSQVVKAPKRTEENVAAKRAFLEATGRIRTKEDDAHSNAMGMEIQEEAVEIRRAEPLIAVQRSEPLAGTAHSSEAYVVRSGDNAYLISNRLGVTYTELAQANNLTSPRDLHVGQRLIIPRNQGAGSM